MSLLLRTLGKRLAFDRKGPSFIITGRKMKIVGTVIGTFSDFFWWEDDGIFGHQGHIYLYT